MPGIALPYGWHRCSLHNWRRRIHAVQKTTLLQLHDGGARSLAHHAQQTVYGMAAISQNQNLPILHAQAFAARVQSLGGRCTAIEHHDLLLGLAPRLTSPGMRPILPRRYDSAMTKL